MASRDFGRTLACTAAIWVGLTVAASPLASQEAPSEADARAYDDAIDHALQEFKLEHWIEAKVLFGQAYRLKPNARALRGIGLASYEARQYVEAVTYFELALIHPSQNLTQEMRDEVAQFLAQARQFTGRLHLEVEPSDAELALDGARVAPQSSDGVVLVDPGPHEVTASAAGYEPVTRRVVVEGGDDVQLQLKLQASGANLAPVAPPATTAAALETGSTTHSAHGRGAAPWVVVGVSGAIAIAGGVMLVVAASNKAQVENAEEPAQWSEYEGLYETGEALFPIGGVMLGVGLAGVAAGLAWELWPTPHAETPAASLRLVVQPGFAQVAGRF